MEREHNPETIKAAVRRGYGDIARGRGGCCSPGGGCDGGVGVSFSPGYDGVAGYVPAADLGLGCGLPTTEAAIVAGEVVLDLGSGAGNDVFIASSLVGPTGRVIGLDMTADMVELARRNAAQLGRRNVEFVHGEIEKMPLPDGAVDLVVSNCVLNLVPDKAAAFKEMRRVLRPGGRFAISDVVLQGTLPAELAAASLLYVGCVAGAMQQDDYLRTITAAGFVDVQVRRSHEIVLPTAMLDEALGPDRTRHSADFPFRILSLTVTGHRPREQA